MKLPLAIVCALPLAACASTTSARLALEDATTPASERAPRAELAEAATRGAAPSAGLLPLDAELQAHGPILLNAPPDLLHPDRERWQQLGGVMQGFLGAYALQTVELSGGDFPPVDGTEEDVTWLPVIGGGGQLKLLGDRIDLGVEAMMSFAWRGNVTAFAAGGGGAVVAVDVDLFLVDLYGGPFVSLFLGDRFRAYGALGPLLQWGRYDQDSGDPDLEGNGDGFGAGWYARTGLEYSVRPGLMAGVGVRWLDATVDLDGGLGELDVEGLQWAFTVTSGL